MSNNIINHKYMNNTIKFISSIAICLLAGFSGSLFTSISVSTWYLQINRPSFAPPNWLFAPVWTTLFVLMGISLFLVWRRQKEVSVKKAVIVFILQFILNILWSAAFFGLRSPLLGLVIIILLLLAIVWAIVEFRKISKIAGWLLVPYVLWTSFATILNLAFYLLNK